MPRISSEKTRQVIVVKEPVFDDTQIPERLALFDEDHRIVSINLILKGEWSAVAGYAQNDLVTFEGSSYLAKMPKAVSFEGNPTPEDDTDTWQLLAVRGGPGLVWRGTWDSAETYSERDLVFYEGSSYRALMEIGPDTPPPGTPENVVPGSDRIAGMASLLWDSASLVRTGTISDADPLDAAGHHVEILRVPIGTPGQIQVDVDYVSPNMDGYLELWRPDGTLATSNDDFGVTYHSRVISAVTPGLWYIVLRYRNPGPVPNGGSSPYSATIEFTAGATFGEDVGNRWEVLVQKGDQGIQGVIGPPGPIANWRGEFNAAAAYSRGDTVYYEGESWWATGNMAAGDAPVPGVDPGWVYVGDFGALGGAQYVYQAHWDEVIEGPLPNSGSGNAVSGAVGVNWFRIQAIPGTSLTITPTTAMFSLYIPTGAFNFFGWTASTIPRTVTVPDSGLLYLEVGPNPGLAAGPVPPWHILIEGTPDESVTPPTWAKVAEKGAQGDVGPSGSGVPAGGVDGEVLTKQSATDGDVGWEPPSGGTPINIIREKNDASIVIPAGTNLVVDTLTFTLDATRMVHLFASQAHSDAPSSHTFDVTLDDVSIASAGNNSSSVTAYNLQAGSSGAPAMSSGYLPPDLTNPGMGIRRVLAAGTHTLKIRTTRGSSGGTISHRLLMAVIYDTDIVDT